MHFPLENYAAARFATDLTTRMCPYVLYRKIAEKAKSE